MFSDFLKKHDLPHKKFHALRHTSATLALSNGINIKAVGARLGHSQLKTTDRYLHALEETERQAANVFGDILTTKNANRHKKSAVLCQRRAAVCVADIIASGI